MIASYQENPSGAYVIGARFNELTYKSMVPLMSAAGYRNVSSFVRDALLTKCKDIATELTDEFEDSVVANKTRAFF